ncbi:hypothetical protein BC834DRAFT_1034629 [Gloeopeniophorella convolvens]|nr:hypothetical protein BC834DRAFT_1034629 [Gloeopeniophorella convolvens]
MPSLPATPSGPTLLPSGERLDELKDTGSAEVVGGTYDEAAPGGLVSPALQGINALGMPGPGVTDSLLFAPPQGPAPAAELIILPGGPTLTFEQARQFLDSHCLLFGLDKPVVKYQELESLPGEDVSSEATMYVGDACVGRGIGTNERMAERNCLIDVTKQLKDRTGALWELLAKDMAESAKNDPPAASGAASADDSDACHIPYSGPEQHSPSSYVVASPSPSPPGTPSWKTVRTVASRRSTVTRSSIFTMRQRAREEQAKTQVEVTDASGRWCRAPSRWWKRLHPFARRQGKTPDDPARSGGPREDSWCMVAGASDSSIWKAAQAQNGPAQLEKDTVGEKPQQECLSRRRAWSQRLRLTSFVCCTM